MNSVRSYFSRLLQKSPTHKLQKYSGGSKNDSFHESIGLVLTIGQCFGLIPIVSVLDKNYQKARFEKFNIRTIYATVFIVLIICEGGLAIRRTHELNYSVGSIQNVLFITVCLSGAVLLFILARRWNALIRFWQQHEKIFLRAPYLNNGVRLKTKINVISIVFLLFALIEHAMAKISGVTYNYKQFTTCKIKNITYLNYWFLKEHSHIFVVIPFNNIYVVPTLWLGVAMTLCWSYVDLIIIVVSIGIAKRFDQINQRLLASTKTNLDVSFWVEIREHYVQVVDLLERVDTELSLLVLLSCANNLYYICLQLYNSFTPIQYFVSILYFWYSLIFLICRTLCVLLFAASIHDASRKSIGVLRDIPSKLWTNETQRFLDLITAECHALSGKRFFYLTKGIILAMAGTVVTYELVLINEVEQDAERKSICNITNFNFSSSS